MMQKIIIIIFMEQTPIRILFDMIEKGIDVGKFKNEFIVLEYVNQKVIYSEGMKALSRSIETDQYVDFDDYYKRHYGTPPVSKSNS